MHAAAASNNAARSKLSWQYGKASKAVPERVANPMLASEMLFGFIPCPANHWAVAPAQRACRAFNGRRFSAGVVIRAILRFTR